MQGAFLSYMPPSLNTWPGAPHDVRHTKAITSSTVTRGFMQITVLCGGNFVKQECKLLTESSRTDPRWPENGEPEGPRGREGLLFLDASRGFAGHEPGRDEHLA